MTPQELKNSILQLAIQGKLVEQRPEEGTTEELLFKHEIRQYEKNGDEFDIPETWKWVYMSDIASILYGFPFESQKFNENRIGIPIIRIRDILPGKTNTYSDESCEEKYRITKGDMLVGMDGNFQVAFWNSEDAWLNQRVCRIVSDTDFLSQQYLYYYLPIVLKEINGSVSYSTVKHLSAKLLDSIIIPLPPLAEQKRIVVKIEELLPLIDRYEKAWNRLEVFNKRFPDDLQKSLLQMAIQGKLVEQRPEEGTGEELYQQIQAVKQKLIKEGKIKKEKTLPEIMEEEKPFDIPESWKWVRLGSVCDKLTDGSHNPPPNTGIGYPVISAKNIKDGVITFSNVDRYTDAEGFAKENKRTEITCGDIILGIIGGSIGNVAIYTHEAKVIAQRSIAIIHSLFMTKYLFYVMKSQFVQSIMRSIASGSAQGGVYLGTINELFIPLPPIEEQNRIVTRLEELLPLCQKLTAC